MKSSGNRVALGLAARPENLDFDTGCSTPAVGGWAPRLQLSGNERTITLVPCTKLEIHNNDLLGRHVHEFDTVIRI